MTVGAWCDARLRWTSVKVEVFTVFGGITRSQYKSIFSLLEIGSALEGRRSRALQKRREEERVCRREYALILVSRLNFSREVATLIVLFALPAGVYNSGQACDPIVVDDVVSGGRAVRRRRTLAEVLPMPATEGYRPPGERTNHIAPPVRAINKQTIGYMNTDHGMALLPGRADWPSRPAFLDEATVVDHDLLQMLDPLLDGDDNMICTYTSTSSS